MNDLNEYWVCITSFALIADDNENSNYKNKQDIMLFKELSICISA